MKIQRRSWHMPRLDTVRKEVETGFFRKRKEVKEVTKWVSEDTILQEIKDFINGLKPGQLVNISERNNYPYSGWVCSVWYWEEENGVV